jgi:anti-sigma regulatory factor (Ser/Thr protein kinase)
VRSLPQPAPLLRPDGTPRRIGKSARVLSTYQTFQFAPDPSAPAATRRRLTELLGPRISRSALANVQLACSELVNNALLHGRGPISVTVELRDGRVRLDVVDQGRAAGRVQMRSGGENGGWGLQIVDRLAHRWGVVEGTTHVWCEIAVPAAAPAAA